MPYNDSHSNFQSCERDSTNNLRASVLDVFRDLGALEDDSVVKAWILDGPESKVTTSSVHSSVPDLDSPEMSPRVNFTPHNQQHTHHHGGGNDSEDSGDETDTGGRRTRNVFRDVISRSFRIRSKSRTRGTKSRARGKSPSQAGPTANHQQHHTTSGYETDEGYNSASSTRRRKVLSKKKRPHGRTSMEEEKQFEVPPLPSPSLEHGTVGSGTFSRFFRSGQHSRKHSEDTFHTSVPSSPCSRVVSPEISTPLSTPSTKGRGRTSAWSSQDSVARENTARAGTLKRNDESTNLPSPANTVPKLRGSRSALNIKRLAGFKSPLPVEMAGCKSVPSSPFLLVAPYGQEDTLVHLGPGSILVESIDDSNKEGARKAAASFSKPISISKTHRRHSRFGDDNEVAGESSQARRCSLDSSIQRMGMTSGMPPRPDLTSAATVPFAVKPAVIAMDPLCRSRSLIPPPRLTNPDASRFAEMDLDD